jgi:hypothetical protein
MFAHKPNTGTYGYNKALLSILQGNHGDLMTLLEANEQEKALNRDDISALIIKAKDNAPMVALLNEALAKMLEKTASATTRASSPTRKT